MLGTLLADLGKNYDPDAALRFLDILKETSKHSELAQNKKNLEHLLENPPEEDTPLHIIYQTPYVLGEVVLAGKKTRQNHPLAQFYPIHFKKTYLKKMSRWETSPTHEAQQSHKVWKHFEEEANMPKANQQPHVPLPIGGDAMTYRSQLLEAKSLGALSPINSNGSPQEILKQILKAKKDYGSVKKLWTGLESLNDQINTLHSGGFLHNDLHKENLMINEMGETPIGCLIDFETTEEDERFNTLEWQTATKDDKRYFLKESCLIFLCANITEQKQILETSKFKKELIEFLKKDPLLIAVQKDIGSEKLRLIIDAHLGTKKLTKVTPNEKNKPTENDIS